jgi:RNA polymerase sigma factor (sigma-70 family)
MPRRIAGPVLQMLESFGNGVGAGVCDRDLLERFIQADDQTAFAALVRRHGKMVLGVCQRLLPTVQDAEDACQATFLILAQKAKTIRWQASIANWLYTTARRVARNARLSAQRRARREARSAVPETVQPVDQLTGRELLTALDEELEKLPPRYREPLVLCYLEGWTRDEAAVQLGVSSSALKSRLERGRQRLGAALSRRGCALGAGLLAIAATSAAEAAPATLVAGVLAAVVDAPSASVAALAQAATLSGAWKKTVLLIAAVGVLAAGLTSAPLQMVRGRFKDAVRPGALGENTAQNKKPNTQPSAADSATVLRIRGRVLLPDDKPAANAIVHRRRLEEAGRPVDTAVAKTGADGWFEVEHSTSDGTFTVIATAAGFAPDWVVCDGKQRELVLKLAEPTVLRGRLVDLEGKPIGAAEVGFSAGSVAADGQTRVMVQNLWFHPQVGRKPVAVKNIANHLPGTTAKTTTDSNGRFEMPGYGKDWVINVHIQREGIEAANLHVVLTADFDPKSAEPAGARRVTAQHWPRPVIYGPQFTHACAPSHVIHGIVTDSVTGQPLAGIRVAGTAEAVTPLTGLNAWANAVVAVTDREGKYRLSGLRKAAVRHLHFHGNESPYLDRLLEVQDVTGYEPITANIKLQRAVIVEGRLVDRANAKPVRGELFYLFLRDPATEHFLYSEEGSAYFPLSSVLGFSLHAQAGIDGKFRLRIPPVPVVILAKAITLGDPARRYASIRVADADRKYLLPQDASVRGRQVGLELKDECFDTLMQLHSLRWANGYTLLKPGLTDETLNVTIEFDRGRTLKGKVVDPDGKPLAGVKAVGIYALDETTATTYDTDEFIVHNLIVGQPRALYFLHERRRLVGTATLQAEASAEPIVRMCSAAGVIGRIVDAAGKPVRGLEMDYQFAERTPNDLIKHTLHGWRSGRWVTDADGRFGLEGMFPGLEFKLFAAKPGRTELDVLADSITLKQEEIRDLGEKTLPRVQEAKDKP